MKLSKCIPILHLFFSVSVTNARVNVTYACVYVSLISMFTLALRYKSRDAGHALLKSNSNL